MGGKPWLVIVPPDPAGTIEFAGALGYTLESAIADLVDNSIDAGAGMVDINFHWNGLASYITVADDGHGMTEAELQTAMAIAARGPRTSRSAAELGRFGVGLKTASFSQALRLSVWTRPAKNNCSQASGRDVIIRLAGMIWSSDASTDPIRHDQVGVLQTCTVSSGR